MSPEETPQGGRATRTTAAEALAATIADAVLGCESVAGLSGGRLGEVATYLPGRRLTGVAVRPDELVVSVIAKWLPLEMVDAQLRAALTPLAAGRPLSIRIDDIEIPGSLAQGDTA